MRKKLQLGLFLVITIAVLSIPTAVRATELTVDTKLPLGANNYHTIQSALNAALAGDSVMVEPGTYSEFITLKSDILLHGRETARTVLSGGGSGTIIKANGVSNTIISNFTFIDAGFAIDVSGDSSLFISNNVFSIGTIFGIRVQNATPLLTTITNNVFFRNSTAINNTNTTAPALAIENNIFAENTTAISSTDATTTNIRYNCFFKNKTDGSVGDTSTNVTADPLFTEPAKIGSTKHDYHLAEGSPCIDAGDPLVSYNDAVDGSLNDMGAYGGPNADTIPYPVAILSSSSTTTAMIVSFTTNSSYIVTNLTDTSKQGGYRAYYNLKTSAITTAPTATSPNVILADIIETKVTRTVISTTAMFSVPTSTLVQPAPPTLFPPSFANNALLLAWSPVSTATKYRVTYSHLISGNTTTQSVVVNAASSFELTGLDNNSVYTISVTAIAQPTYHIAVTAFDRFGPYDPGKTHESELSAESILKLGPDNEGLPSNTITAYPETLAPLASLPNKGCFIATAAYGYYDAPQVQALRDFRDRFLMTNTAGRAFVVWYYEYGPIGAAVMNEHPWLKPVVRAALMPAVGGALFLTRTSLAVQLAVLFCLALFGTLLVLRKKAMLRGGSR